MKKEFNLQEFIRDKFMDYDKVRLVNMEQVYFYMENGIFPLYCEPGYDEKIVFVFLKEPTLRLFGKWREEHGKKKN